MSEKWPEVTIGEICSIQADRREPQHLPADTRYLGLEHIESEHFRILGFGPIEEISSSVSLFQKTDVLFGRLRPYLRKVVLADTDGVCTPEILVLRPNPSLVLPLFLHSVVSSEPVLERCIALSAGTRMPRTKANDLAEIPVLLPPLDVQNRVVDLIVSVDSYIDALRVQAAAARAARASFLNELLNAGGEDWIEGVLGDFAEASWGNTEITKKSYTNSGYTAYSATGPDGLVDWYEHESEGVVLSAIGAQCGKTWLASGRWTPIKNTIWFKATSGTTSNFLFLVTGRTEVWPRRGQAQPFIALSDVRSLPIQLPPPEEQQRIVDLIHTVDDTIVAADVAIDGAVALRSGLLADLLSGDHEIPESYDALLEAS